MDVSVSDLDPGMKVERDVEARGTILLRSNTVLTDAHILRLKRWNVRAIDVHTDQNPDETPTEQDTEQREARLAERKTRLKGINNMFAPYKEHNDMKLLKTCLIEVLEDWHGE